MAPAAISCYACGKSGCKLLRCGRCRTVWFCNRQCQVVAVRQGHSGANCRSADGAPTHTDAEVAPRVPIAAGPSTIGPVNLAPLAPAANTCLACGKSGGKLLLCGRCKNAWFCNRECQIVARKELGHRGANCRPADGAFLDSTAPSQPSTSMDAAKLYQSYEDLMNQGETTRMSNMRIDYLAAADKFKEAASVADLIGGTMGALRRSNAHQLLSSCMFRLGNNAAAARAACSCLQAARVSGCRTILVAALSVCGDAASKAPSEMVNAERARREQERLSGGSPWHGGLDLTQEGRVSLPTTPAALSRLALAYNEAAVAICDAALAAGSRGGPTDNDDWRIPLLSVEAQARGSLGVTLYDLCEDQRSLKLLRQAVALRRQAVRTAAPGNATVLAQRILANELCMLGGIGCHLGSETAKAEACLREALALGKGSSDVRMTVRILRHLINLCGEAHAVVGPIEAEAFRSRLNQLLVQMGRSVETSCSICLEPLAPPAGDAAEDTAGGGGSGGAGGPEDSCVRLLQCDHQFHYGCIMPWRRTTLSLACPPCKK